MSTSEWGSGDEDAERVREREGDVPAGDAEDAGGWSEPDRATGADFGGGATDPVPGDTIGDHAAGGWTESGGHVESGAGVGRESEGADPGGAGADLGGGMGPAGGGAGDIGSESGEARLGGGVDAEEGDRRP